MPRKPPTPTTALPRGYGYIQTVAAPDGLHKVQARWRDGTANRSKTFTAATEQACRDAAIDHLMQVHRDRRDGRYVLPSAMTVSDLLDVYLDRHRSGWNGGTYHAYRTWTDRWIVGSIGGIRLVALTRHQVQDWIDGLADRLAPRTVANVAMLLRAALGHALDLDMIATNPSRGTKAPKARRPPLTVWTADEVARVRAHVVMDPFMRAYYETALLTGLRPGELRALQWGDVDMGRAEVHVRRTATVDDDGAAVTGGRTKTGAERTIALMPMAAAALDAWREAQAGMLRQSPARPLRPFVFSTRADGAMPSANAIRQRHDRVIRDTGVPALTLHGLRHQFATMAMAAGLHPLVVSQVLGHRGVSVTLDVYSHPDTTMQRSALAALVPNPNTTTSEVETGSE